jgi:hypothetical protein
VSPPQTLSLDYLWSSPSGPEALDVLASYDPGPPEVCEVLEAVDQWGYDRIDHLTLNQYEEVRATALSLAHEYPTPDPTAVDEESP